MRTWGLGGGGLSKSHTWYMNISGVSEQDNNNLKYASLSDQHDSYQDIQLSISNKVIVVVLSD